MIQISRMWVKVQGHEYTSWANLDMLYAIFSVIVQRISVKLGWYREGTLSINPMSFKSVRLRSMWDKTEKVVIARIYKWHDIL